MPKQLIIAHRGESFDAPENTLAAITLAWEKNALAIEIDIHLTKDNEIVVIHDADTYRISGVRNVIPKSTLQELKGLDAGSYKDEKWNTERIPTLNEVIETVPKQGKLIIEIKSDAKILSKLKEELSRSKLENSQIEIIAFDIKTLAKAKELMPEYRMLWLMNLDYFWPWWLCPIRPGKIIRTLKRMNIDGVNVWSGRLLTQRFIKKFKKAGMLVYAWTVNDPI
ncbi:MAG: hypothetical protein JEZ03_07175 [Bacteroidales bacterium]|nr:hypothetical protein [Bacteroidales bacterium]